MEVCRKIKGNLSSDVFERRTSIGSVLFALLSRDFEHIREKAHRKKNLLPVDMRRSKMSLLKLPKDGDSG